MGGDVHGLEDPPPGFLTHRAGILEEDVDLQVGPEGVEDVPYREDSDHG
jgi:hypothetical protein